MMIECIPRPASGSGDAASIGIAAAARAIRPSLVLCGHDELTDADLTHWAELTGRAGTANIFAHDWFMSSALRHADGADKIRLAIVKDQSGVWLGVVPLSPAARIGRWPIPVVETWKSTNQFLGSPMIEQGAEEIFWQTLLTHLDRSPGRSLALHCQQFPAEDRVSLALVNVCIAQNRRFLFTDRFERAARRPGMRAISNNSSGRKLLGRLAGLEKRLASDHGAVSIALHPGDQPAGPWINRFLELEKSGWKGRSESALACAASTEMLFRDTIEHGHAIGQARLATLFAGGTAIAMISWFEAGHHGFGFKMAFDETYRTYAPGRILMRFVAAEIDRNPSIFFDSCTPRGTHSGPVLPGRREIVDCVVAIGSPTRRAIFSGLMSIGFACQRLKASLRSARNRAQ